MRAFGQLAACVFVCFAMLVPLFGQSLSTSRTPTKSAATLAIPTMSSMAQAVRTQDYTVEQLRRFREANGNIVTVLERLEVNANGSARPDFSLTFLDVVGEPTGSPVWLEWQQNYQRYARLFFRQGSFSVRDLTKAANNYSLHDFGPIVRAGRSARRFVVFPATLDKAIWVLDVDCQTSVPLFVAEFDKKLSVHAELEAVTFTASVQSLTPMPMTSIVTQLPDFGTAYAFLGGTADVVDPDIGPMPDYDLERVEVHDDPINGRQKLVMSYSDGIDQFLIVQNVDSLNPFDGMPNETSGGNTIARFRDPAVSALVFWDDDITFHIAGRGSLERLDQVARNVYLQALSQ